MSEKLLKSIPVPQSPEKSNQDPPPAVIPIHSQIDNRFLGWTSEDSAKKMLTSGRGVLVRDKKGRARRINLKVQPGDENDPRIFDLMNRMCESRKYVYREIVNKSRHQWVWSHKMSGETLEAFREIGIEGLIKDGVLKCE